MKHLLPLLGVFAFLVGCSSGDSEPAESTDPATPAGTATPGAPGAPGLPGAPGSPGSPGSSSTVDAGGGAQADGSTPTPTPGGAAAFAGAPAYVATLGPSTIDTSGKGNGHLSFNPTGNPAGQACTTCHDGGGKGGAPAFAFAGTVFEDKAATKPAARVEVRVLGSDGKGQSTYTDANGNFFFRQTDGALKAPAIAGVRTATVARSMVNKINDGNCNQCHATGARLTL